LAVGHRFAQGTLGQRLRRLPVQPGAEGLQDRYAALQAPGMALLCRDLLESALDGKEAVAVLQSLAGQGPARLGRRRQRLEGLVESPAGVGPAAHKSHDLQALVGGVAVRVEEDRNTS